MHLQQKKLYNCKKRSKRRMGSRSWELRKRKP